MSVVRYSFLLICIFCYASLFAQVEVPTVGGSQARHPDKQDTTAYYMSNEFQMAYSKADAKFLRLIIFKKPKEYEIQDYYMDGKPKLLAHSTSGEMIFYKDLDGLYVEFFPTGTKKLERSYINGKIKGEERKYYANGNLNTIAQVDNYLSYLQQYQDSTGHILAKDGNGTWIKYFSEKPGNYFTGQVSNGKEQGMWELHLADTSGVYQIGYKDGVVVSGEEVLMEKAGLFSSIDKAPEFPGGDVQLGRFIARNAIYPVKAREKYIQGRVILTFIVRPDGSLDKLYVVKGVGGGLDEEAIRIMSLSPKWTPGSYQGKPVSVPYAIPVAFSLENN